MNRDKLAAALWIRLAKCYGTVLRRVRNGKALARTTLPQFDVLVQLLRHPGGMAMVALSKALLVTAANVTGIVRRLRARGWVAARSPSADRRVRLLRLTPAGERVSRAEIRRHERHLARVFSAVRPATQSRLCSSLDRLRASLEKKA